YRKLVYKHTKKATQITETPLEIGSNRAILFELYGNVGTPAQVFMADSAGEHIFMMSLYYQTALKNDSLQPVTDYMKGEILRMLESLEWQR
ncbi:MAG: gliding motility lipoprotein GldD, partial [Bacteroidetes bacterium]